MKRTFGTTTIALAAVFLGGYAVYAADTHSDSEGLVRDLPVLAAGNKHLQSFRFIGEIQMPNGVPTVFEAGWSKSEGHCLAMVDQFGFPVLFVAQNKMLLNDFATGTVILDEGVDPNVIVQVADGRGTATCGVRAKGDSEFSVDLSSFAPIETVTPEIRESEDRIEIRYASTKGKQTEYVFDVSSDPTIRSMACSHKGRLLIIIRDIVLNRPLPQRLTNFPERDEIPADIRLVDWSMDRSESEDEAQRRTMLMMRALGTPSALERPDLRDKQYWADVTDWEKVAQFQKANGSKLSAILKMAVGNRQIQ